MTYSAQLATMSALAGPPDRGAVSARRLLNSILPCTTINPQDIDGWMIAAANYRILGRWDMARQMYERALDFDRRPELYLNLAESLLHVGERQAAIRNYARAAAFLPQAVAEIQDVSIRRAVYGTMPGAVPQNHLLNSHFDVSGSSGLTRTRGIGLTGESAAADWMQWMTSDGVLETRIDRSTRHRWVGDQALHVRTSVKDAGVVQEWRDTSEENRRVITSAWVFVVRGRVKIGSAETALGQQDAVSTSIGRWERISGFSASCASGLTSIFSATAGGADFYVDDAVVVPSTVPCIVNDPLTPSR